MKKLKIDDGSFRDPDARIVYLNDSVYRIVYPSGFKKFDFIKNILENKSIADFLIKTEEVSQDEVKKLGLDVDTNVRVFKHKKIDYISYPYEWSFHRLKDAALHHLKLHITLLKNNATLIDAYSYNIQFNNYSPIFIDLMSIKEYSEGEFWVGHKQFCESFLNPLVLKSKLGVDYNNWFKGNLEVSTNNLNDILNISEEGETIFSSEIEKKKNVGTAVGLASFKNSIDEFRFLSLEFFFIDRYIPYAAVTPMSGAPLTTISLIAFFISLIFFKYNSLN